MGKIGGLVALGVIALTGCSAPAASSPAPTVTATVAAAPIQAAPTATNEALKPGTFGNPESDAKYLAGVKDKWTGDVPTDAELVGAAKFACQEFAAGKKYMKIYAVAGAPKDEAAASNSQRVAVYAGRTYCVQYNPDNG